MSLHGSFLPCSPIFCILNTCIMHYINAGVSKSTIQIQSETNGCPADKCLKCFNQSGNQCYVPMWKPVCGNGAVFSDKLALFLIVSRGRLLWLQKEVWSYSHKSMRNGSPQTNRWHPGDYVPMSPFFILFLYTVESCGTLKYLQNKTPYL